MPLSVLPTNASASSKSKAPDCSGAFAHEVHPPLERMSVLFATFRSSHVIGVGTSVVLIRWICRAGFVGPAARARPCGHAFFMLRFLARSSAGADGSFTGGAGRGLVLSRRNERRAEERRHDKSRDCKFGSHQKCLRRVTGSLQTPGRELVPARGKHCANFIFKKTLWCSKLFGDHWQTSVTFQNPSPSEHRICAKRFLATVCRKLWIV
jgi:hypothetical protein